MNMKKFLLLLAFLPGLLHAKDLIVLQSGLRFEGHIVRMSPQHLVFENDGQRFRIPASDLAFVGLDEAESMDDVDACLRAYNDTRLRGRQWHNFFGGEFFGPITVIYDLVKTYHPLKDERVLLLSRNKGYFSDPIYLECYSYRAKTSATLQAAGGWATWVLLFSKR
jgi:hypothetical protein